MRNRTISHYKVLHQLGEGGMGRVFCALDMRLEREVAIKFLQDDSRENKAAVERFLREARAASSLNHPNIITIHDTGEAEDGHFIVMELVRGKVLREIMQAPVSAEQVSRIGSQVARALAAAHGAGIIHRDVKPENIMVRDDGLVKLVDFGLARIGARRASELDDTNRETIVSTVSESSLGILGTLRYMSPEQAQAAIVSGSTDIFSLGLVLYEARVGRHPFASDSAGGVVEAILSQEPIPPSRLDSEVSAAFDALILNMLNKDWRLRPSATEVAILLEELPPQRTVPGSRRRLGAERRIVGRTQDLQEMRAALREVASGNGLMLCIAGEPGIGKTTLVEEFLDEMAAPPEAVCIGQGRCSERLAGTEAYLAILDALDDLLQTDDTASTARILKLAAPTWHARLTITSGVATTVSDSDEPQAASQERLKREMVNFLKEASRSFPIILFLDDVHWADASTVDLLSYICGHLQGLRLLIIATYRPSELAVLEHPFLRLKQNTMARKLCRELNIELLRRGEVELYVDMKYARNRFPLELVRTIHKRTEGNPLFVVDTVRYLQDKGSIAVQGGYWVLAEPMSTLEQRLPESIRSLVERKLDLVEETDRRLLAAAAVQGYEFDSTIVAKVLQADAADVEERLDRIERIHALIRKLDERELPDHALTVRYRFVHLVYQNVFHSSLTPTRRVSYSSAVARSLLEHYGDQQSAVASELALLFEAAREWSRAVDYFLLAAHNASLVFAYHEAVMLAWRGLALVSLLPEEHERAEKELSLRATLLVPLLATRGYGDAEVQQVATRARQLCLEIGHNAKLFPILLGLASFYTVRLDFTTARDIVQDLHRMGEESGGSGELLQVQIMRSIIDFYSGAYLEARERAMHGLEVYDSAKHRFLSGISGYDAGVVGRGIMARASWALGFPDRAVSEVYQALELARQIGHPFTLAWAYFFVMTVHICRRDPEKVRSWAESLVTFAKDQGFPYWLPMANFGLGWAIAESGSLAAGIDQMDIPLAPERASGAALSLAANSVILAEAMMHAGRYDAAAALIEDSERAAQKGLRYWDPERERVRGELAVQTGIGDPISHFEKAIDIARQQNAKIFELRGVVSWARLRASQGRRDEARDAISGQLRWFAEGSETRDLEEAQAALADLS